MIRARTIVTIIVVVARMLRNQTYWQSRWAKGDRAALTPGRGHVSGWYQEAARESEVHRGYQRAPNQI